MAKSNSFPQRNEFELVQIAIALCQLYGKDLKQFPPEHYFDEVDSLLAKARVFISEDRVRREALNYFASDLLDTADGYRHGFTLIV
jgi:hypothetical protein